MSWESIATAIIAGLLGSTVPAFLQFLKSRRVEKAQADDLVLQGALSLVEPLKKNLAEANAELAKRKIAAEEQSKQITELQRRLTVRDRQYEQLQEQYAREVALLKDTIEQLKDRIRALEQVNENGKG